MLRLFENLQNREDQRLAQSAHRLPVVGLSKLDVEDLCIYLAQTLEQY